jgi:hypothetical protein
MERDLLPWILGGALITTGAIAAAIEFGHYPSATPAAPPSPASTAIAGPPPTVGLSASISASPAAAPAPESAGASTSAPPAAPSGAPQTAAAGAVGAASPELPAGEVWECVVNGQKVFSDKRCGNGASVRQIGDLNVMDMPPAQPAPYGVYRPGYGAAPYPSPPYPDDEDDTGTVAGDLYPGQAFIVARERARRERMSHQDSHARPPPNRGVSGPRNSH